MWDSSAIRTPLVAPAPPRYYAASAKQQHGMASCASVGSVTAWIVLSSIAPVALKLAADGLVYFRFLFLEFILGGLSIGFALTYRLCFQRAKREWQIAATPCCWNVAVPLGFAAWGGFLDFVAVTCVALAMEGLPPTLTILLSPLASIVSIVWISAPSAAALVRRTNVIALGCGAALGLCSVGLASYACVRTAQQAKPAKWTAHPIFRDMILMLLGQCIYGVAQAVRATHMARMIETASTTAVIRAQAVQNGAAELEAEDDDDDEDEDEYEIIEEEDDAGRIRRRRRRRRRKAPVVQFPKLKDVDRPLIPPSPMLLSATLAWWSLLFSLVIFPFSAALSPSDSPVRHHKGTPGAWPFGASASELAAGLRCTFSGNMGSQWHGVVESHRFHSCFFAVLWILLFVFATVGAQVLRIWWSQRATGDQDAGGWERLPRPVQEADRVIGRMQPRCLCSRERVGTETALLSGGNGPQLAWLHAVWKRWQAPAHAVMVFAIAWSLLALYEGLEVSAASAMAVWEPVRLASLVGSTLALVLLHMPPASAAGNASRKRRAPSSLLLTSVSSARQGSDDDGGARAPDDDDGGGGGGGGPVSTRARTDPSQALGTSSRVIGSLRKTTTAAAGQPVRRSRVRRTQQHLGQAGVIVHRTPVQHLVHEGMRDDDEESGVGPEDGADDTGSVPSSSRSGRSRRDSAQPQGQDGLLTQGSFSIGGGSWLLERTDAERVHRERVAGRTAGCAGGGPPAAWRLWTPVPLPKYNEAETPV